MSFTRGQQILGKIHNFYNSSRRSSRSILGRGVCRLIQLRRRESKYINTLKIINSLSVKLVYFFQNIILLVYLTIIEIKVQIINGKLAMTKITTLEV